jgi:hypothetical protein
MKPGIGLALLGMVSLQAGLGQTGDAASLLRDVAAAYRGLNRFEWSGLSTVSLDGPGLAPATAPFSGAFRRPHSMRIEWHGRGRPDDNLCIVRGAEVWLYYTRLNGFCPSRCAASFTAAAARSHDRSRVVTCLRAY